MEKKTSTPKTFQQGEKVTYIGKGFLGFDKNDATMTFVRYSGEHDAIVEYKDIKGLLVFKYEIK